MPEATFGKGITGLADIYIAGVEAMKEYIGDDKVRRRAPKVELHLSPFFPPFVPVEILSQDFGGIITSCSWGKSRSMGYGTFTIEMAADDKRFEKSIVGYPLRHLWNLAGASLKDIFKPMAFAQLWIDGYHVCTGYLKSFRKRTTQWSKTYVAEFNELGALYNQSVLNFKQIEHGEDLNIINNVAKLEKYAATSVGVPTSLALHNLVQAFIGSTLAYGLKGTPFPYFRMSDGLPLAMRLVAMPAPLGGISNNSIISQVTANLSMFHAAGGQSFWQYLETLAPKPFMEIFTESGGRTICVGRFIPGAGLSVNKLATQYTGILGGVAGGRPGINVSVLLPGFNYLIVRTCPYDNPLLGIAPWSSALYPFTLGVFDLILAGDFIIITDDDVIEKDLGVSEEAQFTVFDVPYSTKSASTSAATLHNRPSVANGPLLPIFPGGVRTYGNRWMEAPINPVSLSWGGAANEVLDRMVKRYGVPGLNPGGKALSTLLNYWFRNAAKFNEGTITTRDIPYARPGMVLLYLPSLKGSKVDDPRDIGIYYIDNIQYSYDFPKAPMTTFSVIRGTPLPLSVENMMHLLMDWEIFTPGPNVSPAEAEHYRQQVQFFEKHLVD